MPNLMRSPLLNKSHSMSETDLANVDLRDCDFSFEENVTQRDCKRPRLADTATESKKTDIRTIIREELSDVLQSLQSQQILRLDTLEQHILDIKNTNTNIETTISFLASQNDELKRKIENLESQNKKDKEQITILEQKLEDIQREGRKKNFEIKNAPRQNDETRETLIDMVKTLSKTVGCKLDERDITDVYRIKGKKGAKSDSPIIVETSSAILKTELLTMCKAFNRRTKQKLCAKHLGCKSNGDTPVFVSEQLTIKGARLFFLARDLARTNNYKYCWTAFGRVYLREHDTSPVITVTNEAQINSLMQKT
ncbi:myosin-2 heavy chain-like [Ostrinia furnacalis]|uniref:myosin-2 heavy chain-like n=1 Tax=Ostrinia furnacalis TaxID=93504 RepID=UPI00103E7C55|nr:myosin-2 heavy chain-like [Ostrinia furnacalis]XP_028172332.1 myosin-2 heavy chain-like [Ostrinia furnacalis]